MLGRITGRSRIKVPSSLPFPSLLVNVLVQSAKRDGKPILIQFRTNSVLYPSTSFSLCWFAYLPFSIAIAPAGSILRRIPLITLPFSNSFDSSEEWTPHLYFAV
jgi:hypothetical protein